MFNERNVDREAWECGVERGSFLRILKKRTPLGSVASKRLSKNADLRDEDTRVPEEPPALEVFLRGRNVWLLNELFDLEERVVRPRGGHLLSARDVAIFRRGRSGRDAKRENRVVVLGRGDCEGQRTPEGLYVSDQLICGDERHHARGVAMEDLPARPRNRRRRIARKRFTKDLGLRKLREALANERLVVLRGNDVDALRIRNAIQSLIGLS